MTFDNPHRRISRVAQPEVPSDSFGSLEETSKQVKRRISRVAFQELHQEEEQGEAWDGDKVSRAEKVVRKLNIPSANSFRSSKRLDDILRSSFILNFHCNLCHNQSALAA